MRHCFSGGEASASSHRQPGLPTSKARRQDRRAVDYRAERHRSDALHRCCPSCPPVSFSGLTVLDCLHCFDVLTLGGESRRTGREAQECDRGLICMSSCAECAPIRIIWALALRRTPTRQLRVVSVQLLGGWTAPHALRDYALPVLRRFGQITYLRVG